MSDGFREQSWGLTLFLSVITLGIYVPYWFKQQSDALTALDVEALNATYITTFFVTAVAQLVFGIELSYTVNGETATFSTNVFSLGDLSSALSLVVLLLLAFQLRSRLEDSFNVEVNP